MNSGVVALRIEASPLVTCTWPHAIRLNGMKLLSAPSTRKPAQVRRDRGMRWPERRATSSMAIAATPKRTSTTVNGRSSPSATLLKNLGGLVR